MRGSRDLATALVLVIATLIAAVVFVYRNTSALDEIASALEGHAESRGRIHQMLRALSRRSSSAGESGAERARDVREAWEEWADGNEERTRELAPAVNAALAEMEAAPRGEARSTVSPALEDVQSALLKRLEGESVEVNARQQELRAAVAYRYRLLVAGVALGLVFFVPVVYRLGRERTAGEAAHAALREREELLRHVVESIRDCAIFSLDLAGNVRAWNRGGERITGYATDEIVGRPFACLYGDSASDDVARHLARTVESGQIEVDGLRQRKDGTRFWANTVIGVLHDTDRNPLGFSVAMRDVTERRRTEEALLQSEERYRAVSELTSDYAYAFRVESSGLVVVEWIAGAFTRITGYEPDEIEQLGPGGGIALVHPEDMQLALTRVRTLLSRQPDTSEFRIITKSGEVRWIRESARPVRDEVSRELRVFSAAQDITERKRAEEDARNHQSELAHVQRVATIGEMASGLAHEINQPLLAIVNFAGGCARRIRAGSIESAELLRVVEEIGAQAMRADRIVRQLGSFIRKQKPHRERLDVNGVVRDVVRLVTGEATQRRVRLRLVLGDHLPVAWANPIEIEQVLVNLVRNALEALSSVPPARRSIEITTRPSELGGIEVAVRDTGDGIRDADPEEIFSAFYTTKPRGLGMGLAISRSIVEAHDGAIWADQGAEGGATFHIRLPQAEP